MRLAGVVFGAYRVLAAFLEHPHSWLSRLLRLHSALASDRQRKARGNWIGAVAGSIGEAAGRREVFARAIPSIGAFPCTRIKRRRMRRVGE